MEGESAENNIVLYPNYWRAWKEYISRLEIEDKRRKRMAAHDFGNVLSSVSALCFLEGNKGNAEAFAKGVQKLEKKLRDGNLDINSIEKRLEGIKELGYVEENTQGLLSYYARVNNFLFRDGCKGLELFVYSALAIGFFDSEGIEEVFAKLDSLNFTLKDIAEAFGVKVGEEQDIPLNWAGALMFWNIFQNARRESLEAGEGNVQVEMKDLSIVVKNKSKKQLPAGYGESFVEEGRIRFGGFLIRQVYAPFAGFNVEFACDETEEGYVVSTIISYGKSEINYENSDFSY